ncbi:MAG: right-handed parallel beta-helix repeat-containing protein, partial [Gemmatimonadetes bacterium]|nr:right-handed parallel beta-helix repeat-containing protein [Gemmatimonadota bacterium]
RNRVYGNGSYGILTDGPALVRDNTIHGNLTDGIRGVFDVLASHGNTIHTNGGRGIYATSSTHMLISNTAVENNGLSGIEFAFGGQLASLLIDNTIRDNGAGSAPAEPQLKEVCGGYVHQVLASGPSGGPPTDGCSFPPPMAPNLCNGSLTCP